MYYIKINDEDTNKLEYYCRNCGHSDTDITNEGLCVLKTEIQRKEHNFSHIINQYTKHDPTLPRFYTIPCPNTQCATNQPNSTIKIEVIYLRYDDDNLKYLYICSTCDNVWRTDKK
jgi:DNA-directed RNA polymerase subunit M/transcription elongation factor TFIIS